MELVSVVIPAYNVEGYLARCLDSVLAQTYGNLEVIVVDDGSTDATGSICDNYAAGDKRVRVIHKDNEGVSAARNSALDNANGTMIAFADADDHMEEDMIMRLYEVIKAEEADMACCGYYEEYTDRTEERGTGKGNIIYNRNEAYEDYFKMGGRIGSGCWNKLIRVEALDGVRYRSFTMGEDVDMLCRTIDRCDKVVCIDFAGYHYIHRDDSATQTVFRPANMDILKVMEDMAEFINAKYPELIKQLYGFHASWYVAALQGMKRSGRMGSYVKEQDELRKGIKKNMPNYRNNPYVYYVDRILLRSYLLHMFVPIQSLYEYISAFRHRRK